MDAKRYPGRRANRAAQKGIRNMWFVGPVYMGLVFAYGGSYHAEWADGSLMTGAIFAILCLATPAVMAVVAIGTYKLMMSDRAMERLARLVRWLEGWPVLRRMIRLSRQPLAALDEWLDRASGDERPLLNRQQKDRRCV